MSTNLLQNLERLHTTELGIQRIRKNLGLSVEDVVLWCRQKIQSADDIVRKGKNWYVYVDDATITVNASSFTIITAHKGTQGVSVPSCEPPERPYTKEQLQVEKDGRMIMPITGEFSHSVNDGCHITRFFDLLREGMERFAVESL